MECPLKDERGKVVSRGVKKLAPAFLQAILLHALLAGGSILIWRFIPPTDPVIYLDVQHLAFVAEPLPQPGQPAEKPDPERSDSHPSSVKPVTPQILPERIKVRPAVLPPKPVLPGPGPSPAPVSLEPAPEASPMQAPPEPPASASPGADLPPVSAATATQTARLPAAEPAAREGEGAAASVAADEQYRRANYGAIRDSILANLRYPMLARRRGWSGQVEVGFTITPDGNVGALKILTSSGFPVLDEQAETAVRRSAPFNPPPPAAVTLVMPITFRLN